MSRIKVQYKLLRSGAKLPTRATPGSAAFDIYAPCDGIIPALSKVNIPIGISHQIAEPFEHPDFALQAIMIPRSGLATRNGVRLFYEGLVDADYRGEIHVCLENTEPVDFEYKAGERVCQMVYVPAFMGDCEEVAELNETQRGQGGFGSTGK